MKKQFLHLAFLSAWFATTQAGELQSIFNGRDLDGWMGKNGFWKVENRAIVGETTPENPIQENTCLIWEDGTVGDFEFTCDVRFTGNNSGVQYRSEPVGDPANFALKGLQAGLHKRQEFFGMLYGEKLGRRGIIATRGQRVEAEGDQSKILGRVGDGATLKGEQWNHLRIVAVGNRIIHLVNDVVTVDVIERHRDAVMSGLLGLQLQSGEPMKVAFKNIQYRALSGEDATTTLEAAAKMQSSSKGNPLDPNNITCLPGFKVEHLYTVPKETEGSWVSLTVDPRGRFYASDQGKAGLFQITVSEKSYGPVTLVSRVEVNAPDKAEVISGAQGLQSAFGSLYFHKNGGHLYRLFDRDGDGELDQAEMIPSETGGGEHGNHDVILSEDGAGLYLAGGNHAPLASHARSTVQSWDEDLLLPRMWDARGHARGRLAPGGWVTRLDPEAKTQEVISIGYRNQYGIALNKYGDLFTFDADMEWDLGSPWYRPTRICHVLSGSDYGWRSGTGKWPSYFEDSLPPLVEIGPGCPTGVVSGAGTKFPEKYRDAIFALDWTFGTIYAIHLRENGAGYTGEAETFLYGTPLPVTDAVVGKDGFLYFIIGGRGTQSALFRVRHDGLSDLASPPPDPEAAQARKLRRSLEAFHGIRNETAVSLAWPYLSDSDRILRHAARVAIESQPVTTWIEKLWKENRSQAVITASVALARSGTKEQQSKLVDKLLALPFESLTEAQQLGWLRALSLTFVRLDRPTPIQRARVLAAVDPLLPTGSKDLDHELLQMLVYLKASTAIEKGVSLMTSRSGPEVPDWSELIARNENYGGTVQAALDNYPPSQEIGYALMLSNLVKGWTLQQRRDYFEFLNEAATGTGGASFSGFLANIRTEALAGCTNEERAALSDLTGENYDPIPDFEIKFPKGPGKTWKLDDAVSSASQKGASFENGRSLYFSVGCGLCHRLGGLGGGVGPDLSTIPAKFDIRYVLEAIINPGKDISDQYGSSVVTMNDGKVHIGIAVELGNRLEIYPPDATAKPVVVASDSIQSIKESQQSQMPSGLLNRLNKEEIRDLTAYLMSGGNPEDARFKK